MIKLPIDEEVLPEKYSRDFESSIEDGASTKARIEGWRAHQRLSAQGLATSRRMKAF
jgi:hypothetical protein